MAFKNECIEVSFIVLQTERSNKQAFPNLKSILCLVTCADKVLL